MLTETALLEKYADIGIYSINKTEIYLPFHVRALFIADCTANNIAIIGIDFLLIQNNTIVAETRCYDFSALASPGSTL